MTSGQLKKGQQTKQKMLDATAALLQERGYHGTGLSEVLRASGAPKGSLYFHFPGGKEQLAAAALEQSGARLHDEFAALLAAAPTLPQGVLAVCQELGRQLEESDYRNGCPIATVALEAAAESDALGAVCSAGYEAWETLLETRLASLGADPEQARKLAVFGLAAVEGGMLLCKAHRSRQPLDIVGEQLALMIAILLPSS